MTYEFRGASIEEAVTKAFKLRAYNRHQSIKSTPNPNPNLEVCKDLYKQYKNVVDILSKYDQDLERLKKKIGYLQQDLDRELVMRSEAGDSVKIKEIIVTVVSLIPAIRAVQIGIRAYKAASSIAKAVAAGDTLAGAVASVSLLNMLGVNFFEPSLEQEIKNLEKEKGDLIISIDFGNKRLKGLVQAMKSSQCSQYDSNFSVM